MVDKKNKPREIDLVQVIKQSIVQVKYEEIGSWLSTHRTPLFYAHEKGLTVVDQKFIDERPWLKKALDKLLKDIEANKQKIIAKTQTINPVDERKDVGYIG